MSESKEFLGKTLDAAIADACAYYDVPREKLEIDIIEDAKSGIFGIVGARKAKIRARLAKLPDFMQLAAMPKPERDGRRRGRNDRRRDRAEEAAPQMQPAEVPAPEVPAMDVTGIQEAPVEISAAPVAEEVSVQENPLEAPEAVAEVQPEAEPEKIELQEENEAPRGRKGRKERQPRQNRHENTPRHDTPREEKNDDGDAMESSLPRVPMAELDQEKLVGAVRTVISTLVSPILDMEPEDIDLSIEVGEYRVQVSVKSEDTGLLIGRDGQNLAAVQYLASRMVTRAVGSQVRVQVDAGDYHMRQDSRLQELALTLAEKVKATGKVQTTRPLSAYQRRVIHLTLQNDPEVQTRSSGEGALKHVVILKRKD